MLKDLSSDPADVADERMVVMVFRMAGYRKLMPSTNFQAELILEVGEDGCKVVKSVQTAHSGNLLNKVAGLDLLDSYLPAELDGNDGA